MALYKRGSTYWLDISHNGKRIQKSTGTKEKIAAKQYHDKIKSELWNAEKIGSKPSYYWFEAALRWINESTHKKSLVDDKYHLRWLDTHLVNITLERINRDFIDSLTELKKKDGVSIATVNRMLALIRSILKKAVHQWEWLEKAPKITLGKELNARVRWLSESEAKTLIDELPPHLADMAMFTLATGLRAANVRLLRWENVNFQACHAWIQAEEAKGNKSIPVPLNIQAIAILNRCKGVHPEYVFTYKGEAVTQCSTRAWRKALVRAGIDDFRWHDLRHTWASWHVQNGTSLQELQQLGGWSSFEMVLRYAHLSSHQLKLAANNLPVTNFLQSGI